MMSLLPFGARKSRAEEILDCVSRGVNRYEARLGYSFLVIGLTFSLGERYDRDRATTVLSLRIVLVQPRLGRPVIGT